MSGMQIHWIEYALLVKIVGHMYAMTMPAQLPLTAEYEAASLPSK